MFLGIVLSYHGEPSLTLAVTACRILLIPACLIPNLIPACTLHPNCLSFPSPYNLLLPFHPLPYHSLFPFILYLGVPSHPTPCCLPFHPTFIFTTQTAPCLSLSPSLYRFLTSFEVYIFSLPHILPYYFLSKPYPSTLPNVVQMNTCHPLNTSNTRNWL